MMKILSFQRVVKITGSFVLIALGSFNLAFAKPSKVPPPPPQEASHEKSVVYAQLSSYQSQQPGMQQKVVKFEGDCDFNGLTVDSDSIIVKESGIYFILVKGVVGTTGVGLSGDVNIWLNRNNNMISSSKTTQTVADNQSLNNIVSQIVVFLEKNDKINVLIKSSSSPTISLIAESDNPSVTLSMYKLGAK